MLLFFYNNYYYYYYLLYPGAYLLSASHDQTVRLWDVASGRCVRLLCGHSAPVRDVSASADGNLAASADEDGHVLLWHLASGAQHADPTLAPAPSPSPDPNPSPNPHPNPHPLTLTP